MSETDLSIGTKSGGSAMPLHVEQLVEPEFSRMQGLALPDLLRDELLSEIFASSVAAYPHSIAMVSGDLKLSYAQVDAQALGIARGLVRLGIGPGDVVGLWMARGVDLLVAQIAITKTGAAWLPFDADAPVDRIAVCLKDCDAKALLTSPACMAKAGDHISCQLLTPYGLTDASDHASVDARILGATPSHPAYLIYTSGSTGVPKGIVISQANICHYLRSANEVYRIDSGDVVFQGASVAFDLSMEEIWVPYLAGARLFVATPEILGEADRLPEVMEAAGVTVLDTVPTLLSLLPRDIASLRIIILGGEACPPSVGQRWCRAGRTIFNSYGPTEATVVATIAEVRAGEAVTIGTPIPNYTCYVVDAELNLVAPGVEGELLIGGPGVAQGYLQRPELTADKFIANPFGPGIAIDPILYRSGDAVVLEASGNIGFRGRIDDQVKIRGFRVELGEIESKLTEQPGISHATVVLRNDDGMDQLVAFIVATRGASLDTKALRTGLRASLPPYMVPSRYEIVGALPRLSSGKADRNTLKRTPLSAAGPMEEQEEPQTPNEAILLAAAKKALPPQAIPFNADFFTDLGGHSLIAARFVSIVRETPQLAGITLQDVYNTRTLRVMAALMDKKFAGAATVRDLSFVPPPLLRRFLCGLAQGLVMPLILGLMTAQWLSVFVSYLLLTDVGSNIFTEMGALLSVYMTVNILTFIIAIAAKWLLLGRTRPGRYPLWGTYYFRWWLAHRFMDLTHIKWLQGSPLMGLFLNALGARVGKDCIIGELDLGAVDLFSMGAGTSSGGKLIIANARVEGNELIIGRVDIGADCYIGTSCVLEGDVIISDGAELADLTSVQAGGRIGKGEIWDGSPARKTGMVDVARLDAPATASEGRKGFQTALYTIMLLIIPPVGLLPIFPAFWVFDQLDGWLSISAANHFYYMMAIPIMAWPTAFVMVLITVGFIAINRWVILPVVKEGTYSVYSWFYFRKWVIGLTTEITLEVLSSLFATIYMRGWYRLMGAKIGKDAEISTNLSGRYDIVDIGAKCFIADEVVLGDEDVRRGWMHLKKVKVGARVFVGNDGVVPPGSMIPDDVLIGIKSKPPANELMSPGDTWFGSPPIKLPVRQRFDGGGANWTYEAPRWKKLMRAVFEAVHISLPTMLFITFGTWAVDVFGQSLEDGKYGDVLVLFILASVAISVALTTVVIVIKWLTMGAYEPVTKPMWSWWAMRTESVAVMYWGMAGKVLLDHLRGTPFLPWVLRLFGTKLGKGIYMNMTDITEYDCVTVGDFCALNSLCALQTHLYEDRVMKVGRVFVGRGVTVGSGSTVLYDTKIGDYARLGPLTLVMKGEEIPANSEWVGAPAEPKAG